MQGLRKFPDFSAIPQSIWRNDEPGTVSAFPIHGRVQKMVTDLFCSQPLRKISGRIQNAWSGNVGLADLFRFIEGNLLPVLEYRAGFSLDRNEKVETPVFFFCMHRAKVEQSGLAGAGGQ